MKIRLHLSEPADLMLEYSPPREPSFEADVVQHDITEKVALLNFLPGQTLAGRAVRRAEVRPRYRNGDCRTVLEGETVIVNGELSFDADRDVQLFIGWIEAA